MAFAFRHKVVGDQLSRENWEAPDTHIGQLSEDNMPESYPTGRTADYTFATVDALDKSQVDHVLTGTADDVAVTAALALGYKVIAFLGTTATFSSTVTFVANKTIILANGVTFNNNNSTPLFADGGKTGCVIRDIITDAGGITYDAQYTTLQNVTLGSYYVGLSVPNFLYNTNFGQAALQNNTTGSYNSALGQAALYSNTTGNYNSAFGQAALYSNTTGYYNSAFGYEALQKNTTGAGNSAFGLAALQNNTTGNDNSAFGLVALQNNTTGNNNSAFGYGALQNNTTGYENSAFGYEALQKNTTGAGNSAFGLIALQNNTTGYENSAFGLAALQNNTTGYENSAFGLAALQNNTTGNDNSAFGYFAGSHNTTQSNQLFIGNFDTGSYANDQTKSLIYGIFDPTVANQQLTFNCGYMGFFGTAAVIQPTSANYGVWTTLANVVTALQALGILGN